jgi:hypothetical protein
LSTLNPVAIRVETTIAALIFVMIVYKSLKQDRIKCNADKFTARIGTTLTQFIIPRAGPGAQSTALGNYKSGRLTTRQILS